MEKSVVFSKLKLYLIIVQRCYNENNFKRTKVSYKKRFKSK